MYHPLQGSLKDLSLDEIITKTSDLHQKLVFAQRMGNHQLAVQVRMVLTGYQEEYQKRMVEAAEKAREDRRLKDKVKIKK
jgi:hypothetical protein